MSGGTSLGNTIIQRLVTVRLGMVLAAALTGLGLLGLVPTGATAAGTWRAETTAPTYFVPGKQTALAITASGTSPSKEITIKDTLPAGVVIESVQFHWSGYLFSVIKGLGFNTNINNGESAICSSASQILTCRMSLPLTGIAGFFSPSQFEPNQTLRVVAVLSVPAAASEGEETNEATVEGGGLTSAATSQKITISPHPSFKFVSSTIHPVESTRVELLPNAPKASEALVYNVVNEPYKQPFTQAGGHPWALTSAFELATEVAGWNENGEIALRPAQDPKDIVGFLPPGLLGDPMAVPRCSLTFITNTKVAGLCPSDTQIGVWRYAIFGKSEQLGPIVNVAPEPGQSAEFALENPGTKGLFEPLLTAHLIRTREGYGFDLADNGIPQVNLRRVEVTFWGVPADASHDSMRGRFCGKSSLNQGLEGLSYGLECENKFEGEPSGQPLVPFVSMPTDCAAGLEELALHADSWQEPAGIAAGERFTAASAEFPAVTGCNLLAFNAGTGVELKPESTAADEPTGLETKLKIPLNESPTTNTTPVLRDTLVTLPEGMSVSPDIVDGLQACEATGPNGINITGPESEETSPLTHEKQLAPGNCPEASVVGTAEAITPFLPVPVKGRVYLAQPGCGGILPPCTEQDVRDGNLYRLYLELGGTGAFADTGIQFKVPLETEVNPATGQITAVSRDLAQALYSEVRIKLTGTPRAPLANSAVCGTTLTTADFTPWSAPGTVESGPDAGLFAAGTPDLQSSQPYEVTGCKSPTPFQPSFVAGTVSAQAGQFSPFTMNLARQDGEQYVKGIQVHTPPGLLGVLASVPLCEEAQADAGTCSEASKIGTTRVATGAGSHPFEVEGNVYLTGPYGGSPFGLSIVVHLDVGPFHLGVKVVRARIAVDPTTSELTVTTDETGPYAVPQIVFGVPVRLKRVTVNIDRAGFMFNPTNCNQLQITATISGSQDASWSASSPFAVAGCRSLAFKPHFTASTNGHTSRKVGASLDVKLSYPKGAIGNDANVAYVKVDLPKQLPSRLTTLQQACTAATFAANPGNCPKGSIVGIVRAHTPLLPVELTGPVYFVSHGGEAFPSLVIVLQGDGVRVDLTGTTFINKANITSSTFKTVPDVPVETFELYLPQGGDSALAANGSLCKARGKLKMPTLFVAQNGARFKQTTKIGVTGCGRAGKAARLRAKQSRHGNGRAGR